MHHIYDILQLYIGLENTFNIITIFYVYFTHISLL